MRRRKHLPKYNTRQTQISTVYFNDRIDNVQNYKGIIFLQRPSNIFYDKLHNIKNPVFCYFICILSLHLLNNVHVQKKDGHLFIRKIILNHKRAADTALDEKLSLVEMYIDFIKIFMRSSVAQQLRTRPGYRWQSWATPA